MLNISSPSSVYILIAKPRGSRTVSAEPLSPARKEYTDWNESIQYAYQQLKNASQDVFLILF
jgi:hypothetical protein